MGEVVVVASDFSGLGSLQDESRHIRKICRLMYMFRVRIFCGCYLIVGAVYC